MDIEICLQVYNIVLKKEAGAEDRPHQKAAESADDRQDEEREHG